MENIFADFDLSNFWDESEYAYEHYVLPPLTDKVITSIENELGYKLSSSYIELMRNKNGGIPRKLAFPTKERTSWADNYVVLTGIFGIGREKTYSLCGELGSQFMIDEWDYPANSYQLN